MFENFKPRGDVDAENLAENLRKPVVVVRFVIMRAHAVIAHAVAPNHSYDSSPRPYRIT